MLRAMTTKPVNGTVKPAQGAIEPVPGMCMEEDEVIQLLDYPDDLEEGELESDVDEALLDEPELIPCSKCNVEMMREASYACLTNKRHNFCNTCTYDSLTGSKYCPSGDRCKYPKKAVPWHWTKEVIEECSKTHIWRTYGNIKTYRCPACSLHCPTSFELAKH